MIQPYSLGTSITRIDGSNIATGTINAGDAVIDGTLTAAKIVARGITSDRIEARALNFINNFTTTASMVDWNGYNTGTFEEISRGPGGTGVRCYKVTTSGDYGTVSKQFDIDCTKSYQCKLTLKLNNETPGGNIYYGLNIFDRYGAELPIEYLHTNGTWVSYGTNPYWLSFSNPCNSAWFDLTGYVMAYDTVPSLAPVPYDGVGGNPYVTVNGESYVGYAGCQVMRFHPAAVSMQVRFLNFYNSGTTRTVWFANPSVSEIGTGTISADTIRSGVLVSPNYAAGNWNAGGAVVTNPVGFKISMTPFSAEDGNGDVWTNKIQAEFGNTVMVGGFPVGSALGVPLGALDFPPLATATSSSKVFYRGNIATGIRGGAPNISCLTIQRGAWDTTNRCCHLKFVLQPTSTSDNLDALRYIRVDLYHQSAAGTTGTLTLIDYYFLPISDRLYTNATDNHMDNAVKSSLIVTNAAISGGYPACLVTIFNAYGGSDINCFYSNTGSVAGSLLVNNGTSWPAGLTGGTGGGTGGGGGGGGGGCVPPGTPFLTSRGWVPVETLLVGDEAIGYDEATHERIVTKVSRLFQYPDRRLVEVRTDKGNLVCSHDHRLAKIDGVIRSYPPASRLAEGDQILHLEPNGEPSLARVLGVMDTGIDSTVHHCTLEKGHVYVAGDFLAHNIKVPYDRY